MPKHRRDTLCTIARIVVTLDEQDYNARMPPEHKGELLTLILMIGLIGLVLIVTIILLMGVWRRQLNRQKAGGSREMSTEQPDIWQAGGQRLLSQIGEEGDADHSPGFGSDGGSDQNPNQDDEYDDGYPREDPF